MRSCNAVNWAAVVLTSTAQFVTAGVPHEYNVKRAIMTQKTMHQCSRPNEPMRYPEGSSG